MELKQVKSVLKSEDLLAQLLPNDEWMYRVKSNSLQKRLLADLEKGIFTDVIFKVGPTENVRAFKAHRLVVGAESSELEKLLSGSTSEEIEIPDVHPKGFDNLLRYCYGVGLRFPGDLSAMSETHLAAEKFKIPSLKIAVEDLLIKTLKPEATIKTLQLSKELEMPQLKERCLQVVSSRFEKVLMTEELTSAPLEVIDLILRLCPSNGLEFNICALVALLRWAKRHKTPEATTLRLLSMIREKHVIFGVVSFFETENVEKLTENQLREFVKDFFAKEYCSLKLNLPVESPDTVGKTSVFSLEGTITEEKASEMEQKTLVQEREDVIDQEKGLEIKGEKETDAGDGTDTEDTDDGTLMVDNIIKDVTRLASLLLKDFVTESSVEIQGNINKAAYNALNLASANMQEVIDTMIDSFKPLYTATSDEKKAETTTTELTDSSSFILGDEK